MSSKAKKKSKKQRKVEKILRIIGYVLCALLLLTGILEGFFIIRMKFVPIRLVAIVGILFLIMTLIFFIMQRWVVPGIITKILMILLICVMVVAAIYLNYTRKKMLDMSGVVTKIDNINVYVLKEDPAQNLTDAKDYTFGILSELDRENTDKVISDITKEVGQSITLVEYDSVDMIAQGLYNGEAQCIVLNSAYIGFIEGTEEYADFEERVRSISYQTIETVVEEDPVPEDVLVADRVFTVYVSGVDTRSKVNENSNSDVNILVTVNMDTRQILMISTPRDYYIPLSISNGRLDKLTHAGGYGIDVSMETLEQYYGANVDDYVRINFAGFVKIIDALGGIDVHSDYNFSIEGHSYQVGMNHLNGEDALMFARDRHSFVDGDRQRGKNQMAVIEAVIQKMMNKEMLMNYTTVLDAISDCMVTSMTYDEISDLVKFQLDDMRGWDIQKYSVNGTDGSGTTYSAGSQVLYVMYPDETTVEQAREYLRKIYAGESFTVPAE